MDQYKTTNTTTYYKGYAICRIDPNTYHIWSPKKFGPRKFLDKHWTLRGAKTLIDKWVKDGYIGPKR